MLELQKRVQEILSQDPWFQAPVQVMIEDREGLNFLISKATAPLKGPVALVLTASGDTDRSMAGTCLLNEAINIYILMSPAVDKTKRVLLEGVGAAISRLHEAVLWPENNDPGAPRIHVTGHGVVEGAKGQAVHEVRLTMPVQIQPATPSPAAPRPYINPAAMHGL